MSPEVQSEAAPENLEEFKGRTDAPFDVIQKGETLAKYPLSFSRKLKDNWDKACKLMDWKVAGAAPDWHFFEVAKDPVAVVKTLQNKIVEKGGTLPKYGVDGKFGSETEKGLAAALVPVETATTRGLGPVDKNHPAETSSLPRNPEAEKALAREKMKEAIDAMPKVEARLDAAGLSLDKHDLEKFSDNGVMMSYQTRAKGFREGVMEKDPRLKPLGKLVDAVIPIVESEVKKIDLSKINSFEDIVRTLEGSMKGLESKMDALRDLVSEKELEEVIKNVKMEELLVFAISAFNEMAVIIVNHFAKDKANLERVGKILLDESMLILKKAGIDVDQSSGRITVRDLNPPPEAVKTSHEIEISYKGKEVLIDPDTLTIQVGDKKAHLVVPTGAEVKSVKLAPNGDLILTAGAGALMIDNTIAKADLEKYFDKIAAAPSGSSIDLGSGATLQVA